jgi:chemotaxis protein CheZ
MRANKRAFRIETISRPEAMIAHAAMAGTGAAGHHEILTEIKQLKALIRPAEEVTKQMIDAYRAEMQEAMKLKAELDQIWQAIDQTKHEIATLHVTGFQGKQMTRVTHELDAIVTGTEEATEGILSAAEGIEHCNFQDLTGQRITKVVNTLKFIEDRIVKMMEIWGGLDSFKDIEVEAIAEATGDAALLNGPKLEADAGHASQDDIDALFN